MVVAVVNGIEVVVEPLLSLIAIVSVISFQIAVVPEKPGVIVISNEAGLLPLMWRGRTGLSVENTRDHLKEILATETTIYGREMHLQVVAAPEIELPPLALCLQSAKTVHISSSTIRRESRWPLLPSYSLAILDVTMMRNTSPLGLTTQEGSLLSCNHRLRLQSHRVLLSGSTTDLLPRHLQIHHHHRHHLRRRQRNLLRYQGQQSKNHPSQALAFNRRVVLKPSVRPQHPFPYNNLKDLHRRWTIVPKSMSHPAYSVNHRKVLVVQPTSHPDMVRTKSPTDQRSQACKPIDPCHQTCHQDPEVPLEYLLSRERRP